MDKKLNPKVEKILDISKSIKGIISTVTLDKFQGKVLFIK